MTHPQLTRAHLEATLVAIACVRRDLAPSIAERVDRLCVSRSAVALLEALAEDDRDHAWIWADTAGQRELMLRVDAMTVADLFFWPLDVLLSLVNQLPEREQKPAAWERDLERGTCAA